MLYVNNEEKAREQFKNLFQPTNPVVTENLPPMPRKQFKIQVSRAPQVKRQKGYLYKEMRSSR
jgi:hypothetical protein